MKLEGMDRELHQVLRREAEALGPRELTGFLESIVYMLAYHLEAGSHHGGKPPDSPAPDFARCRDAILADLGATGMAAEMQRAVLDQYGPPCFTAARRILATRAATRHRHVPPERPHQ